MPPYKINVFTGTLDYYEASGGPGVQSPNYVQTFNATTDWGAASGGFYTIIIPLVTHAKGSNPVIQICELIGGEYDVVETTVFIDSATSAISIKALETPDSRFEGKIVISENN
jgi:hypothetical protein